MIRKHKPALLAVLAADSLRDEYEERAAIAEFDGGLSRAAAERQAWERVVTLWLNDPANADPPVSDGSCPACRAPLDASEVLVLRAGGGHTPLHARCTRRWLAIRRAEAARAGRAWHPYAAGVGGAG